MTGVLSRITTEVGAGRTRIGTFYKRHSLTINLGALLTVLFVVAFWQWITIVVPAGYVGVKWYRFAGGTNTQAIYAEGNHFLWPWDRMAIYDTRLQQISRDFDVLTRDGMMMTVNIAFRFRLNDAMAGPLHKHVGADYVETLLVPTVGSYARSVFSQNSTDSIYTDRRTAIQGEIKQAVIGELDHDLGQEDRHRVPWLFLDDVLIRSMRFPADVQSAVNRKMEQYQLQQEYTYRLKREELESQRKEVEARGIARFQSIVGAGISDTYLRWKGIDATLALAQSPNAKIVVIGTGKDGMPLILGGTDLPAPEPAQPGPRDRSGVAALSGNEAGGNEAKTEVPPSTLPPASPDPRSGAVPQGETPATDQMRPSAEMSFPEATLDEMIETLRKLARLNRPDNPDVEPAPSSASATLSTPSSSVSTETPVTSTTNDIRAVGNY
jgi:regulator of protease activity HflC (stomatin/prohibitin superfamily)